MAVNSWKRKEPEALYVLKALEIMSDVEDLLCKEDIFPKRRLWMIPRTIIDISTQLAVNVSLANEIRAVTLEESEHRHKLLTIAQSYLKTLDVLLFYVKRKRGINANRLDRIVENIEHENRLLSGVLSKEKRRMDTLSSYHHRP